MLREIPELFGYAVVKTASDALLSYGLGGRLYLSSSGWMLLSVPNAFVHGCFKALQEPGAELPTHGDGLVHAHISVIRPDELEQIGGAYRVTERGKIFRYTLGQTREVNPAGWDEMERCWFVEVHSPDLERLRRSYGLASLPNDDKYKFHITFAVRRKGVLGKNDQTKQSSNRPVLSALLEAKRHSDQRNYEAKADIMRRLMTKFPSQFEVDSPDDHYPGITHTPTKFKMHVPSSVVMQTIGPRTTEKIKHTPD